MKRLILSGIMAAIIGVLVYFAAITVTFIPGVAALYPASAFEVAFGAWFGLWGCIASYLGLLVAGSLGGWFAVPSGLLLSFSDFVLAFSGTIAVRLFKINPELPTWKSAAHFVTVSLVFGSIPGSLWYNYINLRLGLLSGWNSFVVAVFGWNLGNLIILIVIGVPLLRYGTKTIRKTGLLLDKWF